MPIFKKNLRGDFWEKIPNFSFFSMFFRKGKEEGLSRSLSRSHSRPTSPVDNENNFIGPDIEIIPEQLNNSEALGT